MAIPGLYVALALLPVLLGLLRPLHSNNVFPFEPASDNSSPRLLLLTAHPDDETFFFGPTLTSLIPSSGVSLSPSPTHSNSVPFALPHVYSLCFSVGNADGLGYERRRELRDSLDVLGVAEDKRWVLDKNEFQDNITAMWNASLIAATVYDFISDHDISIILTFDSYGVSGHPNHYSLYHGVSELLAMPPASFKYPLAAYSLTSKSVVTKYIGIMAPILVKLKMTFSSVLQSTGHGTENGSPDLPVRPIFVAGIGGYYRAVLATLQHRSQRAWFRWLYMVFSQYLWVNEWERIHATVDVKTL
ncbi:LmbE-like protein [Lactarius deliciosus]|nr:LmbE-like protein [Lactarius deliciosus]